MSVYGVNLHPASVPAVSPPASASLGINLQAGSLSDWGFAEIQMFSRALSPTEFFQVASDMSTRRADPADRSFPALHVY